MEVGCCPADCGVRLDVGVVKLREILMGIYPLPTAATVEQTKFPVTDVGGKSLGVPHHGVSEV